MDYDSFLKEKEKIDKLPVEKRKEFYSELLKQDKQESNTRLHAYFEYASLLFYEGDFRKAREVLEPFVINYQSYEYIPQMVKCLNLMGVASQCEEEYAYARYFYTLAKKVVEEHDELQYYAYEYNNISLTYIALVNKFWTRNIKK